MTNNYRLLNFRRRQPLLSTWLSFTALFTIFLLGSIRSSAQFAGAYAPANWSIVHVAGANGSVNAAGAPASIILTGPDGVGGNAYTRYQITMTASGNVSFSWNVIHNDPTYDGFGYYKNGTYFELTQVTASGSTSVPVVSGDVFAFYGHTFDGCCGTFNATITNFSAPNPCVVTVAPVATPANICVGLSSTLNANAAGGATLITWNPGGLTGASVTVSPAATTTYTVSATNGVCTSSGTVQVTVNNIIPPATITQTPANPLPCGVQPTLSGPNGVVPPAPGARYYVRDSDPWGVTNNTTAMTAVFGAGNYITTNFAGANPVTVFSPATQFVFLEGSDGNANALNNYLTTNLPTIQTWVNNGGRLFLNAAPNQGGNINFGFGGVTLNYSNAQNTVNYTAGHPIVLGPYTPAGTGPFTGGSYSHAHVTGPGIVPIATGSGFNVLAEKPWGAGLVMFGGITQPNFHSPAPNVQNIWQNIIHYTANSLQGPVYTYLWMPGFATTQSITAPTTGIYTLMVAQNGCSSSSTISVTVTELPTVNANPAAPAVCAGNPVTLTGSGNAISYTWDGGISDGIAFIPANTQIYTVTGTGANGCTNTATALVTVNPVNTGTGSANPATICLGDGTTIDGSATPICAGNLDNFAGPYAPGNWTVNNVNSNGAVNTLGAPASIAMASGNNLSGTPGTTGYQIAVSCSGNMTFNWAYTHVDAFGSIFDYPRYTINGGAPNLFTGFVLGGSNNQNGTQTIPVNVGDVVQLQMYCLDNDPTQGFVTISNFAAPAPAVTGTASVWDAAVGGTNLGAPPVNVTPGAAGIVNYYLEITSNGPGSCVNPSRVAVPVNVNDAPVVTASITPASTCEKTVALPSVSISGGTAPFTTTWTAPLVDNTPFIAMANGTYTATVSDANGCTGSSTASVTVTPMTGTLAPATSNQSQDHGDDFDINYYDASCDLIATVDDGAGGNILGLTTATVNVMANAGTHNGQPYVRRWYQITPTNNGAADVVLYINQSDFDDYNAAVLPPYLPLPTTGNNADPNIANIRITKNDDAGLGNNPIVITPAVNWNGTYWELSFNTPSFSQFRVHSVNPMNIPLPATITQFSGVKMETSDKLMWSTSSEQNNAYFNLQHSTDGKTYSNIAKVNSKAPNGNSQVNLNYVSYNEKPVLGKNYYRLQQVDIDNNVTIHNEIVITNWGADGSVVSLYPNPTNDVLNIDLQAVKSQMTTVKVMDMSGRVVKQIDAKTVVGMNNIKVNLGEFANGMYTVQVLENNQLIHTGKVRLNK